MFRRILSIAMFPILIAAGIGTHWAASQAHYSYAVFPPEKGRSYAAVLHVVDGDTVRLALLTDIGNCRLLGINTPERGRPGAKEATDFLSGKCPVHRVFKVDFDGKDKYGRFLVILRSDSGESINDMLLTAGLAKPYHGEKRSD